MANLTPLVGFTETFWEIGWRTSFLDVTAGFWGLVRLLCGLVRPTLFLVGKSAALG